jgi:hypothetical protein
MLTFTTCSNVPPTAASAAFEILERLHGLAAEVARHLAGRIDAQLPGNVDDAAGPGRFHHMSIAARWVNVRRIDEARVGHLEPPFDVCCHSDA